MVTSIKSARQVRPASGSGRKRQSHEEDDHQKYLFEFMELAYFKYYDGSMRKVTDYLFAIPNGGKRNKLEAVRLKKQGVKAGVSDMFLPIPFNDRCGLWMELKVGKGKPSGDQLDWIDRMVDIGYLAVVIWGWKSAAKAIDAYLGGLYTKAGKRLTLDGF